MKYAVKIARIVMCAVVSLYTLYLCGLMGHSAYLKSYRITVKGEDGYGMVWGGVVQNAALYGGIALIMLLLGIASIILLFRRSRTAAVGAAVCAVVCAVFGICHDTMLSEYMFMKYPLGLTTIPIDLALFIKPLLAGLCIGISVLYVTLCLIAHHRKNTKED